MSKKSSKQQPAPPPPVLWRKVRTSVSLPDYVVEEFNWCADMHFMSRATALDYAVREFCDRRRHRSACRQAAMERKAKGKKVKR